MPIPSWSRKDAGLRSGYLIPARALDARVGQVGEMFFEERHAP
jgi:hypothetical protein